MTHQLNLALPPISGMDNTRYFKVCTLYVSGPFHPATSTTHKALPVWYVDGSWQIQTNRRYYLWALLPEIKLID